MVSSANIIASSTKDAFLRSLTYDKNRSDPKMEPCGTPHFTTQYSVPQLSST